MDKTAEYVWCEYRNWALTSRTLKARLTNVGKVVLVMTILGTAGGTVSPVLVGSVDDRLAAALPWVSAVVLGIAAYLTAQLLAESERQTWIRARAVAEALKSEVFKYLAGAAPYDVPNAATLLAEKGFELQRADAIVKNQVPREDRSKGLPKAPMAVSDYVERRVREQIDAYYMPGIRRHQNAMRRAKFIALIAGIAVVILSAGSSTQPWTAPVLGTLTTAAAAVATWFQSGRHQQLALNYQQAITKLELLIARYETGFADKQLVLEAEAIFQAEHAAWLSEWQSPPSAAATTS